jgi:hypothetical protein
MKDIKIDKLEALVCIMLRSYPANEVEDLLRQVSTASGWGHANTINDTCLVLHDSFLKYARHLISKITSDEYTVKVHND